MSGQNTGKENESYSECDAEYLDLTQSKTYGRNERYNNYSLQSRVF